jgi:hypothetical protein
VEPPRRGGAENLINVAYLYSHSALANRALALTYAEGAVAAPEWHYVRDVLWPQILELPRPYSGEAGKPGPGPARPATAAEALLLVRHRPPHRSRRGTDA